MSGRLTGWLWLLWVALVVALTVNILVWDVEMFRSPGAQFFMAVLVFLPVLTVACFGYAWWRRKFLWRFEPLAFAAFATAAILFREPRALLANALLFVAAYVAGEWTADKLRLTLPGTVARILVRCGLGCGLLIPLLFLMGEFRLLRPAVILPVLLLVIAVRFKTLREALRDLRSLDKNWKNAPSLRSPLVGVAMVFAFIAMVCTLMVALAPSITFDTLQMHLPSAQYYVQQHSISPFEQISYSYFPQGGETLWTAAYALAGAEGMQIESVIFFGLFLLLIFGLARECGFEPAAAVIGAIWAGTLPFLHWTGSVVKNDMMMTLFQGLALYAFLRWLRDRQFSWIIVGVFFLAQSFGIKYVAAFGGLPLAIFFGYAIVKQQRRLLALAATLGVFLLFGAFWTARTYVLTGNPAYPASFHQAAKGAANTHGEAAPGKLTRYLKLPWTIIFAGHNTFESPLNNPAGVILFAFIPPALLALANWRNPAVLACIAFTLIYYAGWAWVLSALRYAIVPFAIASLLLAQAALRFYNTQPAKIVRISVAGLEVYCLMIAMLGALIIEVNGPQIAYVTGSLNKQGYLRAALRTYRSLEFLQHAATPGSKVFGIDNCSRAYAPEPLNFQCMLCPDSGCDPAAYLPGLRQYQPKYVIAPESLAARSIPAEFGDGRAPIRLYSDGYFDVYQIRER